MLRISEEVLTHNIWRSMRLVYCICAFFAMILHLILRNTFNMVVLFMTRDSNASETDRTIGEPECISKEEERIMSERMLQGVLLSWTRNEQFYVQSFFYLGYAITLPIGGLLCDKWGSKIFFVWSIILQSFIFLMIPSIAKFGSMYVCLLCFLQGLIAGFGNPPIYKLFTVWAHPSERTALVSFAFGGFSVGTLISYPLTNYFCQYGWSSAFYCIGLISLIMGVCFHMLVYDTLQKHPYISKTEYNYLNSAIKKPKTTGNVPWLSIAKSKAFYGFSVTHVLHSYGVVTILTIGPRFFKEGMGFKLSEVGWISAMSPLGAISSKFLTLFCYYFEDQQNMGLTTFRKYVFVYSAVASIITLMIIVACTCKDKLLVVVMTFIYGFHYDLGFTGAYWPSLLNFAPSFSGIIMGITNSISTIFTFLTPIVISTFVTNGTKQEWNYVIMSMIGGLGVAAIFYIFTGSSDLQPWDPVYT